MTEDTAKVRWLHFSDFHVGKDNYGQRKLFKEIVQYVSFLHDNGFSPDLIFITGDVADSGDIKQYETFLSEFIGPLKRALPEISEDAIFVVPGNHDVISNINKYFARHEITASNSRFFDPTEEGLVERKQILPRFSGYIEASIPPSDWVDSENGSFSRKIDVKGRKIGVAGINTAWLSKSDDRHRLTPGIDILEDVLKKLDDTEVKIVLGHHPIDWFDDSHVAPIRSILGRYNAIYLHGHLHNNRASPEDGAGYGFLSVQSGAAFQARADEKWVNGFMLAELTSSSNPILRLQPREWNATKREWNLSKDLPNRRKIAESDWWGFPIPVNEYSESNKGNLSASTDSLRYPVGWQLIDSDYLSRQQCGENAQGHLNYIDGAEPDWEIVTSDIIPVRDIVSELVDKVTKFARKGKPQVALLSGPVGEGKSTAIMQSITLLAKSNSSFNVLWNQGGTSPLKYEELLALPQTDLPWLFVSDSADLIAEDIKIVCKLLSKHQRADIRFLICCRDTDWRAIKAHTWRWNRFSYFTHLVLSGLKYDDASHIVNYWTGIGEEALGDLYSLQLEEATDLLFQAAHEESPRREGALIGAILKVRYGGLLKEHVMALLHRLSNRDIPGGGTLFDAFAYIAAMHAENLGYLSRPVLSEALRCPLELINTHVLIPLGLEAATSSDGLFILTRHKTIAEISVDLIPDVFQVDIERLYYELLDAALTAKFSNFVPQLSRWLYSFPGHFGKKGRSDLAIRFGKRVLEKVPNNTSLIISLSLIYRSSANAKQATELFRNYKGEKFDQRNFYSEWGAAEGAAGEYYSSPVLLLYSLSDQVASLPPRKQVAIKVVSSIYQYLKELRGKYPDPLFLRTQKKCVILKEAPIKKADENESEDAIVINSMEAPQYDVSEALDIVLEGMRYAINYFMPTREEERVKWIDSDQITFFGLLKLVEGAEHI